MHKIGLLVLIVLLMSGCFASPTDLAVSMNKVMNEIESAEAITKITHRRTHFTYYLPRHLGKRFSDQDNVVFVRNQTEFYMYLDVSRIIIEEYYKNNVPAQAPASSASLIGDLVYERQGALRNSSNSLRDYSLTIEQIDDIYLVYLEFGVTRFTALLALSEIEGVVSDMFTIARSMKVDRPAVLADYSNKSMVVINNKYDLFEVIFPESGVIADVLNPNTGGFAHEEQTGLPDDMLPDPGIHEESGGN